MSLTKRTALDPFFFHVYALKAAHKSMLPAAGTLAWTGSKHAQRANRWSRCSKAKSFQTKRSKTISCKTRSEQIYQPTRTQRRQFQWAR